MGRVSQDLGKGSNVGLMYTDEEFGGGWNRIGGADFTWRLNNHWTVLGQMVESSTKQNNPDSTATIFPAGYSAGPASDLQVQRNGHSFNLFNEYQDVSTGFTSTLGFFQTSNIRSDHLHANYQWFPKNSVIQSFGLETNQNIAFDHAHNRVYHYSTFDPFRAAAEEHCAGAARRAELGHGGAAGWISDDCERELHGELRRVCGARAAVGAAQLQYAGAQAAAM